MVISSLPAYLDPAYLHQQQQNHQDGSGLTSHFPPPLPPPQPPQPHGSGGAGSIRPGSMVDRARMANILMLAEAAQKCPRCESTNTKFCYFNNYSLSQPRYFCKTCRRYWTRGGALRSVPVGGGCRRNKRSKGSSSKSPATSDPQIGSSSTSDQIPPLRCMPPMHHLTDLSTAGEIGLNFNGISGQMGKTSDLNFFLGSNGGGSILGGLEQWRLQQAQQFPFMATGLDFSPGMYPIEGGVVETSGYVGGTSQVVRPKLSGSVVSQLASVKMEDNQQLNLSRQFMEIQGNDQYWSSSSSAWTDLSGFSFSTH